MIIELLDILFLLLTTIMIAYIVRHYIFTLSVLKLANKQKSPSIPDLKFEPTVSILIPAFNEEKVIGRLLNRITNLSYPKGKLQVIVINDASTDTTGNIAEQYKKHYPFIDILHRGGGIGREENLQP